MRKVLLTVLALTVLAGTVTASGRAASSTTAGGTTTVEFFNLKREVYDIMEKLIGDFQAQNPGVVIQQTITPDPWSVLTTRIMGGDMPEIFAAWSGPDFTNWVQEGYVADLTGQPAVANVSLDALNQVRINGRDYLIPISHNAMGLWINVNLFRQCNLNTPTTWAELVKACETFKAAGITPALIGGKEPETVRQDANGYLLSMPSWSALEGDRAKGNVDFTDRSKPYYQDIRDMAQRVLQWFSYSEPDALGAARDSLRNDFAIGRGAMYAEGSWAIPTLLAVNPNLNFTLIPFPAVNAGDTKVGMASDDFALTYSATAKHPDIAKKFLEFMTSKDAAQYYAENDGSPSCIKGVSYASPYLQYTADLINAGKGFRYPNDPLTQGQLDGEAVAFQGLYAKGDIEAFCRELQRVFNNP